MWEEILARYLNEKRLKKSAKRERIIKFFFKVDKHLNVDELYEKLGKKVSRSTIYRTLKLLTKCGLAIEQKFEEKNRRYEPAHLSHHDHFICLKCGEIIEFNDKKIENTQNKIAQKYNFKIVSHKLEIYGYCEKCQKG
ncbi:MAG: transcriptional repressor [candidate division WOR-3 bacterium]|nr:transcriptional repressor [candidate division WOR-3 bacterium]MCX7837082.1 transcriptional repressor [candidate division WOR-3 bacterium]MDW8114247.1 transcriptional repressor [candidate division WOR-3 bacterium]